MDTFTNIIDDLLPNPADTFVAIIDGHYLLVDRSLCPTFGAFVITNALQLIRYPGYGKVLGTVIWVISDPRHALPALPETAIHSPHWDCDTP